MSIDMQKIVDNFAQALESARKTRSKKLICDCDQSLHWKKRAKELAGRVVAHKLTEKLLSLLSTEDFPEVSPLEISFSPLKDQIYPLAQKILKEIESEDE